MLLIGARVHALQVDPVNGREPQFVNTKDQSGFCICTGATLAQVLISIIVTLALPDVADTKQNVKETW